MDGYDRVKLTRGGIAGGAAVVEFIFGWNSGGGVMLDVLTLSDESLLVISEDAVAHYANWDAFYGGAALGALVLA